MGILNLLFPPRCPLCGNLLKLNEGRAHGTCYNKLPWVKEPRCKRCGKPILSETGEWCRDCFESREKQSHSFDSGRALWLYQGDIQQSVLDYKYQGLKTYTPFYADEVVRVLEGWIRKKNPQLLLPVPLHPRKKRIRGFNQAELLAKAIGRKMELPVDTTILMRDRWTEPQKNISGRERRHNLTKSMSIHHLPNNLKRVILIDDIYTTGSTIEACAGLLKKAGVEKVYFITLCIGIGEP